MSASSRILGVHSALVLLGVFAFACVGGYWVVREAVSSTIERQALTVAEIVATQATTARTVYAREVAGKLSQDGFGPHVESKHMRGYVPIPAQFLKMVGQASSEDSDRLYEYRPVSRWNLEPSQGLRDDFLRWAWPQLEAQDKSEPAAPIAWQPVWRIETVKGQRVLRYLSADPASQSSCVACHNAYEKRPDVVAMRQAASVPQGKQWLQHQLMGALSVSIPLNDAERLGGAQINQTAVFIVIILVLSFTSIFWFHWRLSRQAQTLREVEEQVQRAEFEARSANVLLAANQGVEQAFSELSTYMTAIDQHAIVSVADCKGKIVQVNDKLLEISGYSRDELIGRDHRVLSSQTHSREFFAHLWKTIESGEIWRGTICNRRKDGQLYWVDSAIVPLKDSGGAVVRYISIRIDITERKRAEHDLLRMATHDVLTGLVNRNLLRDRIQQALECDKRSDDRSAVLFIDLDQFKAINDGFGHEVGDKVLVEVARRLRESVRAEDTVARQGGDEFIVFMPRLASAHGAATLAEKVQTELAKTFHIDGRDLHIGSSIGIALYPEDGEDADALLKNSDSAMYQVKEAGRNHFMFFAPYMNQLAQARYSMISDLRGAIEREELHLNFQPIMDMRSGMVAAMEVLLRWQHPVRGAVSPVQFIPVAESSGLIVPIGDWVLRTACQQIKDWQRAGLCVPQLAINLSVIQVHSKNVVERIANILSESGVPASAIELEITESSLMHNTEEVVVKLKQLNALGIRIAIDDFGTGYSSLSYLKRLPIDTLKIDRSFVMDIHSDADDAAIVGAVVSMAHSLNLKVIAEGVETAEQLDFLRNVACEQYQGYLASKPMTADDAAIWLGRNS